jgi:acyl-CoA synthetase (AMP-forming)/AMP-acid ligase II|tara:strand:+ start:573 stop:2147 length:1575 start_codon:yes stop_codon:yes gene_type:complete
LNTFDLLEIACAIVPDRPAFVAGENGEIKPDFATFRDRASRLASVLSGMGVGPGDRVALMDVNTPAHAETYFASAMLDAIYVPVNFRSRTTEANHMLERAAPSVVLAGARYMKLIDTCDSVDVETTCRIALETGTSGNGWASYEGAISAAEPYLGYPTGDDNDTTMIMFTSGSTSAPKGVTLTHGSFTSFVMDNVPPADPDAIECNLLTVPLYHIAGVQSMMSGVWGGRTLVLQPQFEPEGWMELVQRENVTRAMMVPTMLKTLMDHPKFSNFDLSSLDVITYGAAAMPESVILEAIERFPGVKFINAFGQTETAATITMLPPEDHDLTGTPEEIEKKRRRLRSIGVPLDGVEVQIMNEEGHQAPENELGEIVARGKRLMKGYWGDDTNKALNSAGWLHTGDLGYRDEDGYIFLTGRAREIIKRGGEMISPEEVEEALESHEAVREASVIGVPDTTWGEIVHAVVVIENGTVVTETELIEHTRRVLASYKKPEKIHFADELPRNALGKVIRPRVKETFGGAQEL